MLAAQSADLLAPLKILDGHIAARNGLAVATGAKASVLTPAA